MKDKKTQEGADLRKQVEQEHSKVARIWHDLEEERKNAERNVSVLESYEECAQNWCGELEDALESNDVKTLRKVLASRERDDVRQRIAEGY